MPDFFYEALDAFGKKVSGTISGGTRAAAIEGVYEKGLHPISIEESAKPAEAVAEKKLFSRTIPQSCVETFIRQLANLLTAGVPLGRSLEIVIRETTHPAANRTWNEIRNDVMGGSSLANALAKWPKTFSPVYVAMVRGGEAGGFLNLVLEQIADFRAREEALAGRVKAALIYPAILAVLSFGVLLFMLVFFIPRFTNIFADFGGSLPQLTLIIVGFSKFLVRYGIFFLLLAIIAGIAVKRALSLEKGRRVYERISLKTPMLGRLLSRFAMVRFCRMLGTLLSAGVPLVNALTIARESIGNFTLSDTVSIASENVKSGSSLARGLGTSTNLFPPAVVEMVAISEESGNLDKELIRISSAYEGDLERQLRMLVAVLEPLLLFIMAAIVGTVVIGMLLPIFTLQDLVR